MVSEGFCREKRREKNWRGIYGLPVAEQTLAAGLVPALQARSLLVTSVTGELLAWDCLDRSVTGGHGLVSTA